MQQNQSPSPSPSHPRSPFPSIRNIPIPKDLSQQQTGEYLACREALCSLEAEWNQRFNDNNGDVSAVMTHFQEIKEQKDHQAEEKLRLRLEIVAKESEQERENVNTEIDEAKKQLFETVVRGYSDVYQKLCSRIENLMTRTGGDYERFIQANSIEFPIMGGESQRKFKSQSGGKQANQMAMQELDKVLHTVETLFREWE
jgi:hypothetical protein